MDFVMLCNTYTIASANTNMIRTTVIWGADIPTSEPSPGFTMMATSASASIATKMISAAVKSIRM